MSPAQRALAERQARISSFGGPLKEYLPGPTEHMNPNAQEGLEALGLGPGLEKIPAKGGGFNFVKPTAEALKAGAQGTKEAGEAVNKAPAEGLEAAAGAAASWVSDLLQGAGIRLLEIVGGSLLVLFGLYVLVKGDVPSAGKVVKHVL